jgi:hypothetical protein
MNSLRASIVISSQAALAISSLESAAPRSSGSAWHLPPGSVVVEDMISKKWVVANCYSEKCPGNSMGIVLKALSEPNSLARTDETKRF